ncbi:ScpA family protein [Hahella sp. CCB-MM4]|uniref:segregation and condensation protein A n=1 Tax=Hahella sp. (strain CCB-MM4) TaxID=1926491 RepID=UPI000B9B7B8F|nr:ScpA family protein [Hahella sp. CCB-MM4]
MTEQNPSDNQQQLPQQQELPLAVVEGKPVTEIPQDLYIPPDALEVFLESFEGPLDLLLYLIRRQNMDILNIDVSEVTRQYMEYIQIMQDMRFELAAEYLVMAAMLAEIKSRFLLPRRESEEEEEDDPRAELIRRLQQYERFKTAAENLDELPRMDRDYAEAQPEVPKITKVKKHPDVELVEVLLAFREVLKRSELFEHHQVEREKLSTRERMTQVLDRLSADQFTRFVDLFKAEEGRLGVVVTFLAVLELVKESLVELVQTEIFGEIHVRARGDKLDTDDQVDGDESPADTVDVESAFEEAVPHSIEAENMDEADGMEKGENEDQGADKDIRANKDDAAISEDQDPRVELEVQNDPE